MSADPGQNRSAPLPGRLLRESRANHQRGRETVGGRLLLSDQVLCFVPHALNLSSEPASFPLAAVTGVRPVSTKLLGAVPIAPNSVAVTFADGSVQRFVLPERRSWIIDIESAARAAGARIP